MSQLRNLALSGVAVALVMGAGASKSFAVEPGDFQATLRGATIGIPLGAAPPPGIYAGLEDFIGPNGVGQGQNSAGAGANGGRGLTVFGAAIAPSLVWAPGWKFFNGDVVFAVVQPFFTVAGLGTNGSGGPISTEPIDFGSASFFENVHNTVFSGADSWNLGQGWHGSLGFSVQGPDGSQDNGTLNQDYWTFSPTAALAYFSKDWKITANFEYDIHTASAGHTGTYAALASLTGVSAFAAPGDGYTTGNQAFLDWAAEYKIGKWSVGPAGYFKWQTTSDSPGGGFTCASLAANPMFGPSLSCGHATDIALGGIVGYDIGGGAELETIFTDSVYTRDDFKGTSIFERLSFKLWGPDAAASPMKPILGKAQ